MANLVEVINYDSGVYQIETSDPVLGGESGVTNAPLKNLTNRTAWLKKHVDDLESGTTIPAGLASQAYVQDELAKLDHKQSVRAGTVENITLSAPQTIDGIAVIAGERVLVKNQTTASQNGIYVVNATGWVRASDANTNGELTSGMIVGIEEGTTQANSRWQLTTDGTIIIGTTNLTFADVTSGLARLATSVQKDTDTGAALIPVGTTGQRPSLGAGKLRFNSDTFRFEGNNGSAWGSLGGATGGGNDAVFYLNDQTVNNDYTLAGTQNAMSAGPITIANGKTVTLANGATWTVV